MFLGVIGERKIGALPLYYIFKMCKKPYVFCVFFLELRNNL